MTKRILLLLLWISAILIPLEWVTKTIPVIKRSFDFLISSELSHIIGHLILFGGLAFLVLYIFRFPLRWEVAVLLALAVISVGLVQEFFQLQVKMRAFGFPEIFDLGVDLSGAGLGWLGYSYFQRYERYLRIVYYILRDV